MRVKRMPITKTEIIRREIIKKINKIGKNISFPQLAEIPWTIGDKSLVGVHDDGTYLPLTLGLSQAAIEAICSLCNDEVIELTQFYAHDETIFYLNKGKNWIA